MNDGSGRPRFMDTFKAALAPRAPIVIDKDAPNPIPRTVKIAGAFAVLAGVASILTGALYVTTRQATVDSLYANIQQCTDANIGLGDAVTATSPEDLVAICKTIARIPTDEDISTFMSSSLMVGIVLLVIGIAALTSGIFLFKGARWARRLVTTVGAVLLVGTMLGLFGGLLLLVASLLMLIGLAMIWVGKGATYFIRAKAQGLK